MRLDIRVQNVFIWLRTGTSNSGFVNKVMNLRREFLDQLKDR
jgi:hypothetical protein